MPNPEHDVAARSFDALITLALNSMGVRGEVDPGRPPPSPPPPQALFYDIVDKISEIREYSELVYEHINADDGTQLCKSLAVEKRVERKSTRYDHWSQGDGEDHCFPSCQ